MQPFRKIYTDSTDLNRVQDNVDLVLSPVLANKLLSGNLIQSQQILTTGTSIPHGLGRKHIGYITTKIGSNAVIWEEASPLPDTNVFLKSSATVIIDIWVF
jgi:hypothetical protein